MNEITSANVCLCTPTSVIIIPSCVDTSETTIGTVRVSSEFPMRSTEMRESKLPSVSDTVKNSSLKVILTAIGNRNRLHNM